ncbi:coiled-coil domain-containing protein 102B isoform X1 [Rhinatrema bivittatum]|uniref:coiled-coil domain-containing protein 102B isoform X1 n=1 Tax=Rhinatrema bivittatum TaxID=194408 RepID=UPI001129BAEC|nr:coiled-coil domain-containing protein 102B isoform X1 [Rhinatrema bivittatum]
MNLESVSNLREGTEDPRTEESSSRQHYELVGACLQPEDICVLNLPAHRLHSYSLQHPCVYLGDSSDWETSEVLRAQELEEIKARATQMEKTMRWWSDCTANWREKWSKVRDERNKAREEVRQLRLKLEMIMKELSILKKEKQDLINEKEQLKAEIIWEKKTDFLEACHTGKIHQMGFPEEIFEKDRIKNNQSPIIEEGSRKLNIIHETHQNELGKLSEDLEDEIEVRTNMDRNMGELSTQLERMQFENSTEREKREILEMEKLEMEIENRNLKTQIGALQELLATKSDLTASALETDFNAAKSELLEKNKELADLQHAYHKLKKQYQNKMAELDHANRRVEQHEGEMKKLRIRVEELKRDLAKAEDELDDSLNQIGKLQRSLEEHTEAKYNLPVQFNHLQNRLRNQQNISSVLDIKQASIYGPRDSPETGGEDEEVDLHIP